MLKKIALLSLCLFALMGCQSHVSHMDNGHSHHNHHSHGTLEAESPFPSVDLVVYVDPKSGWNLQIITENFVWSPQGASGEHVAGEGHGHLYVNGEKINRIYGQWQHIPELTKGTHEITVTLNANSHEDLTVDGKVVSDTEFIIVD